MDFTQVAIIGAGPAGIATAVQLQRFNIPALVFEKDQPGGLLKNGQAIENFPGFPSPVSGLQLTNLLHKQLKKHNIRLLKKEVTNIYWNKNEQLFIIEGNDFHCYCRILVVASGTTAKKPDHYNKLPDLVKNNIYFEVYQLLNRKNRHFVIIGAGDASFDYALNLARSNMVTILNRNNQIKALSALQKHVERNSSITYLPDVIMHEPQTNSNGELIVRFNRENKPYTIVADKLIYAIGREPEQTFYSESLLIRENDLKKKGLLYLAGDVNNNRFRQASIAFGDGIKTAMKIYFSPSAC